MGGEKENWWIMPETNLEATVKDSAFDPEVRKDPDQRSDVALHSFPKDHSACFMEHRPWGGQGQKQGGQLGSFHPVATWHTYRHR